MRPRAPIWGLDPICASPALPPSSSRSTRALIPATVLARAQPRTSSSSTLQRRQSRVLISAILTTVLVNGFVLRRRFAPLESLIDTMERVDLAEPGCAPPVTRPTPDVARLHDAFNRMLVRLEARARAGPRRPPRAGGRARAARARPARRGQPVADRRAAAPACLAPTRPSAAAELRETPEAATQAMDELLRLARELRPAALDDHGLEAALRTQVDRFTGETGVDATLRRRPRPRRARRGRAARRLPRRAGASPTSPHHAGAAVTVELRRATGARSCA